MAMQHESDESRLTRSSISTLKRFVRALNESGAQYSEIAEIASDASLVIDEAALKQFTYRSSKNPRVTPLVSRLISSSQALLELGTRRNPKAAPYLLSLSEAFTAIEPMTSNNTFDEKIHGLFQISSKLSSNLPIPDRYFFVRKSQKNQNQFYKLIIDTKKIKESYYYTMKIIGNSGSRVVFGIYYDCLKSINLVGMSYPINELLSNKSLLEINIIENFHDFRKYFSQTPVGMETIYIPKEYIGDTFIPVSFSGLDAKANPFFGSGVLMNEHSLKQSRLYDDFIVEDLNSAETQSKYPEIFEKISIKQSKTSSPLSYLYE